MLRRISWAHALLGLVGVVACGGTVKVEPGAVGGAPGNAGTPGSAGAPGLAVAGSGNSGNVSGGSGGVSGSLGMAGESGDAGTTGTCVVNGVVHAIGESFACDCNTCWCEPDGTISGTLKACPECLYAGESYYTGEKFPDRDGCNQCECTSSGYASCTEKYCGCDRDQEWYRHYIATSTATCALADYVCPAKTVAFGNDCGCGCEQDISCPPWVDCEPGNESCDPMRKLCPYSQVAF